MYTSINGFHISQQNIRLLALRMLVLLPVCLLLVIGFHLQLLALLTCAIAVGLAYRFPLSTVTAFLIVGVLPEVFQMTPNFTWRFKDLGIGVDIDQVILLAMLGAVLLETVRTTGRQAFAGGVSKYVIILGFWLLFEILRNVATYRLHAPGEFRGEYLILALPIYVTLFFSSCGDRKRLLKVLIFATLFFPLLSIPVIGQLQGWGSGFGRRFFPGATSLGILYGMMALIYARKYELLNLRSVVVWATSFLAIIMVLVDGHRSVWLAALAGLAMLFLTGEMSVPRSTLYVITLLLFVAGIILILPGFDRFLLAYIDQRTTAFTDYRNDTTASWRAAIWTNLLGKITLSPFTGEGFGGWWRIRMSGAGEVLTVSPHSLYIQSLVKIGAIGLSLYVLIIWKLVKEFWRFLKREGARAKPEYVLIATAFVVLVASHAFYVAYAFECYTWSFVGLGLAAVRDNVQSQSV
jgi:O-antigen ligase